MSSELQDRLFVPLSKEAFEWFRSTKEWEIRRLNIGQYNLRNIRVGRVVELRMGYRRGKSIWGRISDVKIFENVVQLVKEVFYKKIIPDAETEYEAMQLIEKYVGLNNQILAFKLEKDNKSR